MVHVRGKELQSGHSSHSLHHVEHDHADGVRFFAGGTAYRPNAKDLVFRQFTQARFDLFLECQERLDRRGKNLVTPISKS